MVNLISSPGGIRRTGNFPMGLTFSDMSYVKVSGNSVEVYRSGGGLVFTLPLAETTIDGESFTVVEDLVAKLLSFKSGGGNGGTNPGVTALQWSDAATLAEALKLARRDGYGSIIIPVATEIDQAVNLGQLNTALLTKVDKEEGKGLSTNDFSNAYMAKLDAVEDPLFLGSFPNIASLQALPGDRKSGQYAYVQGMDNGVEVIFTYQWVVANNDWEILRGASNAETPASVKTKYESNANTNAFTDAEKAKLAGIAPGAQVNDPAGATPTFDQVVKRNNTSFSSFFLNNSANASGRVGLEDVDGIGSAFSADKSGESGFIFFDGAKWVIRKRTNVATDLILNIPGRATVNAPLESRDIANKEYVDNALLSKFISRTTENGLTTTEYNDRFEYTAKISINRSIAANSFFTATTTTFLPQGLTIAGCDEHYISIVNNNRTVFISVYDNQPNRNIYINFWNVYGASATVVGSVFMKLVKFK